MKTIAEAVLKDLKKKIDSTDSMVNISGLPEVHADADSMKLLLTHLVDNALKFQQKDKRPYVEILAIKENQNIQFCVKDNGIGVDPRYHETIFEPFKRLNRADEFPGTGIGLSICKKIIAAHGGKIWIESKEGLGSNFFFTLPVS
jgi:signal transduction histidine kinase